MCDRSLVGGAPTESLFEANIAPQIVDHYLPEKLSAFPDMNAPISERLKKNIFLNTKVMGFIRGPVSSRHQSIVETNFAHLFSLMETYTTDESTKYNYVLVGDKLIVLQLKAGKRYLRWLMTKHLIISHYSSDVRMAGELWKTADGKLHFNLNSGTYKPSFDSSRATESVFNYLFPNMTVENDAVEFYH